jgi:hypothetical protein
VLFSWDSLLGLVNPEPNPEKALCLLLLLTLDDPQGFAAYLAPLRQAE